jgi:hypothetical protein
LIEWKIAELAKIAEWRTECERLRLEMEKAVEVNRETWSNWLELREEAAELEKEEVDTELELIQLREQAHDEELEIHGKMLNETEAEDKRLIKEALTVNERIEQESAARFETLEKTRAKGGQKTRADQAKGSPSS